MFSKSFFTVIGLSSSVFIHVYGLSLSSNSTQNLPLFNVKVAPDSLEIQLIDTKNFIEPQILKENSEKKVEEKIKDFQKNLLEEKRTASQKNEKKTSLLNSITSTGVKKQALPKFLENKPPKYPEKARKRGWEGVVLLKAKILSSGNVEKIELKESSGYDILDRAAVTALQNWQFKPAQVDNKKVNSEIEIPIKFEIE